MSPPLSLFDDDGLPLSLLGGLGLLSLGGVGLLSVDGGLLLSVPDGGFVVGDVDCVGQFALESITDPSGHVFVVGGVDDGTDVNGGVVVDGVNEWVHDGSIGFFVQSTGGAIPVVQLPAASCRSCTLSS